MFDLACRIMSGQVSGGIGQVGALWTGHRYIMTPAAELIPFPFAGLMSPQTIVSDGRQFVSGPPPSARAHSDPSPAGAATPVVTGNWKTDPQVIAEADEKIES